MDKVKDDSVKERILDASIKLFLARGFHGTTVKELTNAAGVAKGTLYWYFKSKDQLLEEILDKFSQELTNGVFKKVRACNGGFISKFKLFYKSITELAAKKRELLLVCNTLLGELMGSGTEAEAKMTAIHERQHSFIKTLLDGGKKERIIRKDLDTNLYAHVIQADFIGMHLQWCLKGDSFDVPAYARLFRESIFRGLGIDNIQ